MNEAKVSLHGKSCAVCPHSQTIPTSHWFHPFFRDLQHLMHGKQRVAAWAELSRWTLNPHGKYTFQKKRCCFPLVISDIHVRQSKSLKNLGPWAHVLFELTTRTVLAKKNHLPSLATSRNNLITTNINCCSNRNFSSPPYVCFCVEVPPISWRTSIFCCIPTYWSLRCCWGACFFTETKGIMFKELRTSPKVRVKKKKPP